MDFTAAFPQSTESDWRAAVDRVLRQADFDKIMVGKTADNISFSPIYPRAEGAKPILSSRDNGAWKIAALHADPEIERGNSLLHEDLLGGADCVVLSFATSVGSRGFGLPDHSIASLDAALAGVHCDLVDLRLEPSPFRGFELAQSFAEFAKIKGLPPASLNVDFGISPFADRAIYEHEQSGFASEMINISKIIHNLRDDGFAGSFLNCDARPFHEAGASEGQELAIVIAQGVSYLRALELNGFSIDDARRCLSFILVADDDQFLTIAKFRALRLLWARIEETCDLVPENIKIHAETSFRMMTKFDAYTNILRTTIASFAAGTGGADSIEILPHTIALGLPDALARRLARNTSLILIEESNLQRVFDPAMGAGSIENLTNSLSTKAWEIFQLIESQEQAEEKGMIAALHNGFLSDAIKNMRDLRKKAIATRKIPITGISEFPTLDEVESAILASSPLDQLIGVAKNSAFPSERLAQPYEDLRDRADGILKKNGRRPTVFLANLGKIADFNVRVTFARNFFEVGGFEVINNDGFADDAGITNLEVLISAFKASKADFTCISSSDTQYFGDENLAIKTAIALEKAGSKGIFIAGKPNEYEAELRKAGINEFIYVGCNVLDILDSALTKANA